MAVLQKKSWLMVCGDTGDARDARALCEKERPEIIVLDLDMRGGDGLLREFTRLRPGVHVLALSERKDSDSLQRTFQVGACGYIAKSDPEREILAGVEYLMQGAKYVSHGLRHALEQRVTDGEVSPVERRVNTLTDREREVLRLMALGDGPKDIAGSLGVSVKTVESHFARMQRKLGIRGMPAMRRLAVEWLLGSEGTGSKRKSRRSDGD
jgi:DNA-binding NarL/FixJ family response regulator